MTWNPTYDYLKMANSELKTEEMNNSLKATALLTKALQSELLNVKKEVQSQGTSVSSAMELLETSLTKKLNASSSSQEAQYIELSHRQDHLEKKMDPL